MTLDTVADESRTKMADGVARSPSRLCSRDGSRDGKILVLWRRLEYDFLACLLMCLDSYFRFSFFFSLLNLFFPASRYVYLLRVPSSVQQPSTTLSNHVFIVRALSVCCVICTIPHHGILLFFIRLVFFFVAPISRVAFFFVVLSYPVR